MAHVRMLPSASSLLHFHKHMTEIYVMTRGRGKLVLDNKHCEIQPSDIALVSPDTHHMLKNLNDELSPALEHLVFAVPPFNPTDVHVVVGKKPRRLFYNVLPAPNIEDAFDGAKIMPYHFPHIDLSFAYGWVYNDQERRNPPHYHKKTREWIYVVSGRGMVELNGVTWPIRERDWVEIVPGEEHAFRNQQAAPLTIVCVCSPRFDPSDVYYR